MVMNSSKLFGWAIVAILNGAVLLPTSTRAATASGNAEESPDSLAEIIVTAQRRSENLEKVPLSITALSNRTLGDLHIQSFSDLASIVPGYTDAYFVDAAYRGVTNGVFAASECRGRQARGVPPWTASLHGDYSRSIGNLWNNTQGYVRADYRWLDAAPKANPNTANYDPATGPNAALQAAA
jgi:hypothetical protein